MLNALQQGTRHTLEYLSWENHAKDGTCREINGQVLELSPYGLVFVKEGKSTPVFLPWHVVLRCYENALIDAPDKKGA